MGNIIKLDDHLANMIAAGEVVEKPSSVVKELVENAIDAHAQKITINLLESGTKLIEIIDDGCGMSEEDAKMCFVRHATSKIKNEHDLFRIQTLGFRGEAIPSIASISKFKLYTSNGIDSTNVVYNAGKLISVNACAMNKGTKIDVENLFYNVPARLKYLRSLKTELNSISYTVQKFILANPNTAFRFTNDNKTIYQTNGNNNLIEIFGSLYGLEVARNIISDSWSDTGYKIKAYIAKNSISRSNNLEITTVINGRFIKSNVINEAVVAAYKTLIPEGRYPIALIYIDIDPLLIDVNVHPSKMTIKIANERQIASLITSKLKLLLERNNLIPDASVSEHKDGFKKEKLFDETLKLKDEFRVEEKTNNLNLNEDVFSFKSLLSDNKKEEIKEIKEEPITTQISGNVQPLKEVYENEIVETNVNNNVSFEEDLIPQSMKYSEKRIPYLKYIGSLHATYLLFEGEDGLYIMDQHAAAERVNYEYYYNVLSHPKCNKIPLILPINIELTSIEMSNLEQNLDSFKALGFEMNQSGENSYFVREIPSWLHLEDVSNFLHDTIKEYSSNLEENIMKYRDNISKQIACKASLKANHNVTKVEIDTLINNLSKCNSPFTCPHGRPTIIKITINELEKMFMRIM